MRQIKPWRPSDHINPVSPDKLSCLWPRRRSSGSPPPRPWAPWRGRRGWCPLSPGHWSLCCGGCYLSSPDSPGPHSRLPPHFSLTSAWTGRERGTHGTQLRLIRWWWCYVSLGSLHSLDGQQYCRAHWASTDRSGFLHFLFTCDLRWAALDWLDHSLVTWHLVQASQSAVTSSGLKLTANQLIRIFHWVQFTQGYVGGLHSLCWSKVTVCGSPHSSLSTD